MQFHFERFVAFFMLFILCGVSLIIFQAKWEGFFRELQRMVEEFVHDVSVVMQTGQDEKDTEPKRRQKITLEAVCRHWTIPMLLILCFPIEYIIVSKIFSLETKSNVSPLLLLAIILIPLTLLVIGVFAHSEKNICHKFWMELVITLFLEIFIAYIVHNLLSGYYFQNTIRMKWMYSHVTISVPFFIYYCIKTQKNWQIMLEQKTNKKQSDF